MSDFLLPSIYLNSGTHFLKQNQANLADIKIGDNLMASIKDKGQDLEATLVQILLKP